jgi:FlaG/FlaF family flagellin (archaellin)
MTVAMMVAIVAIVAGVFLVEAAGEADQWSKFAFALLDRLVSDESLLEVPEMSTSAATQRYSSHAA